MKRVAIVAGVRTPIGKNGGVMKDMHAVELGVASVSALMSRLPLKNDEIDELIFGNVAQPSDSANIARVIALNASLSKQMPAFTVHRNCASGMESITTGALKIMGGHATTILAGGTESMSNIPLLFNKQMTEYFYALMDKKTTGLKKLAHLMKFRPSLLTPRIGLVEGLTDPTCGINMGMTAENLAKEFGISRSQQDAYAIESHERAMKARTAGFFKDEIAPLYNHYTGQNIVDDECVRAGQTLEKLATFKPYFDKSSAGTVTVVNACPTNDGAAAVLLMDEEKAVSMGLKPLGYIREFAYAGLDAHRMGLGPVFSTAKVLERAGMTLNDMDFIEINEAFAVQVLSCLKAFDSDSFAQKELGLKKKVGTVDTTKLNVNGGSIAIGHPVGISGTRIILTLLRQLEKANKNVGLATLCIGGGQGGSVIVERN